MKYVLLMTLDIPVQLYYHLRGICVSLCVCLVPLDIFEALRLKAKEAKKKKENSINQEAIKKKLGLATH